MQPVAPHFTHRVAVIGYVFDGEKFLLLKRLNPPCYWAPPGGHLYPDEDPRQGVRREIREETGLDVRVMAPVDIWFQKWQGYYLLSIDFLVEPLSHEVRLSAEHSAFEWVSLDDLKKGTPIQLSQHPTAFKLEDFQKAQRLYQFLKSLK